MFSANITNRDPAEILLKNTADREFPLYIYNYVARPGALNSQTKLPAESASKELGFCVTPFTLGNLTHKASTRTANHNR
jgi:hypothetical protein